MTMTTTHSAKVIEEMSGDHAPVHGFCPSRQRKLQASHYRDVSGSDERLDQEVQKNKNSQAALLKLIGCER